MKRIALWLAGLLAALFLLVPAAQAQTASDYTQGVEVSGSTAKIWFKPTSTQTTWVDVHYQLNGGTTQSLRMTYNSATGRHEQNVLTPVATGNTLAYHFTYNKGSPAYDTSTFNFTVGSTGGGTVATPSFSPAPGTYASAQSVSITSATSGAQIRYTTDGSTPTATSALYSGPLSVGSTRTVKAIAIASGMSNSAVATGVYTINTSGGFSFTQGVDLSGTTATIWFQPSQTISFADVHYQVNGGAQQNFRMTVVGGRHQTSIANVATGQVIAYWFTYSLTGATTVDTGGYSYTVGGTGGGSVAAPVFTPAPGTYTGTQNVTMASATSGATIRYTTDGSTPNATSTTYSGAIAVASTKTIKAYASKSGMTDSAVTSGVYTIQPSSGTWNGMTTFNIVNQTNGKWADSQVYWAIIGRDWNTGNFVHVDINGNLVPMSTADNGALTKNGQNYTNYFFSLAQKKSITIPAIDSARILMSVGGPMYIQVNVDINGKIGYAGANIANPADPNTDVIFDFGEMAILPKGNPNQGIYINTTRVDQFGFPLKLRLQGLNGYDKTVGEALTETRDQLFAKFIAETPAEFGGLAKAPYAPMRIMAPSHATFQNGQVNANYLQPYIDAVWAKYRNEDLVFTLDNLGTFRGRVSGDRFTFTGGTANGTYFINGKPSTSMAFLGNGFLDDTSGGPTNAGTQLQIQAQICAALNRHVVEQPANWYVQSAHHPAGQASNWFSKFWHDHSIDKLAYGFAYDDVGGFSPSLHTDAPTVVTYTIGW